MKTPALILLILAATAVVSAQDYPMEKVLQAHYETLILTLHHPLQQPIQQFDMKGKPVAGGPEGAPAAYGRILIDRLRVVEDRILLEGRRISLAPGEQGGNPAPVPGEPVQIEIKLKSRSADLDDARAAMRRVFHETPEDSLWSSWLCEAGSNTCEHVHSTGKDVTVPQPLFSPHPEMSERARRAKFQGVVVLGLLVDKTGKVRRINVIRELGMDLDEQAISKISSWKFKPASRNGQPVAAALSVEVSFNLY